MTITGSNFPGVSAVRFFNGVNAIFSVINSTTITVTVPSGSVSGPITIFKGGCLEQNSATFTVTQSAPTNAISGTVSYCGSTSARTMSGVTIIASGAGSPSITTDSAGAYRLSNLGGGPYTLTPSKTGDVNGISSFDAALVAQHTAGIITLGNCQQAAGDSSNNTSLSLFDSSLIAQHAAGIANAANIAGSWKFLPANRTYASLSGEQTGQNFSGVLVGDVSGNWSSSGAGFTVDNGSLKYASAFIGQQSNISLPQLAAAPGASLTVPVTVSNLSGLGIIAYDLDIIFDQNVLQLQNTSFDATGTISDGMTITANGTSGRLRISAFGTTALSGMGTLLNLKFTVTGANGSNTSLTWRRFVFNETLQTNLTGGRAAIGRPVASVSAASYMGVSLAPESIVAAFGSDLATETVIASSVPLPTNLAGTTVKVRDSTGQEREASLFFVTSVQINYLIPAGTAIGVATITVRSGNGNVSTGLANISSIAPGLFSADLSGEGLAAATALRIKPGGVMVDEAAVRFDPAQGKIVAVPIDLGPVGDDVFLVLFGTGIRFNSGLGSVSCQVGGTNAQVLYAGSQGSFIGLDQMNVRLPRSLAGRGEVNVVVTIDGRTMRTLKVNIK